MDLLTFIVVVVVVGVIMWLINQYVPMAEPIKMVLNVVVAIAVLLWAVTLLLGGAPSIRIGK